MNLEKSLIRREIRKDQRNLYRQITMVNTLPRSITFTTVKPGEGVPKTGGGGSGGGESEKGKSQTEDGDGGGAGKDEDEKTKVDEERE
jgi:hypothetical protein